MTDVMHERDFADTATTTPRPFKRVNGCLISADYNTPASEQMYGYKLEPLA